jgi:hypothetical protein
MENILARLEKLEKEMEQIQNSLRKKVEERKLKLVEKFDTHDRAQNLLREFEAMGLDEAAIPTKHKEELKTIIKCLVELVDSALGVEFP